MFTKLLKHEWQATRGIIGLLCVIILIAGITIGITMYTMISASQDGATVAIDGTIVLETLQPISEFAEVAGVLLIMAGVGAVAICTAGSLFFLIYRFYKRCFTDEGYLTFTLPVTNHQILLSSLLNTIVGELLVILSCVVAVAIAFFLFLIAANYQVNWADLWVQWSDAWQQIVESFWKNADQFALVGFSGIVGAISELILLMTAVTIGALIARKHKILAAVGVYYGIGLVKSFVYTMFAVGATTTQDVNTLLATPGLMGAVLAVGGYFGMHYLISRKLNLT